MNLNNSANETKINGFITNWDENIQLVYSEDRSIPLADNQMNIAYSTHKIEGFQKLMYWLITNPEHRITVFLVEDSRVDGAIHTIIHSFLNALRSYSGDAYTEMMKVIGSGDVNDSLFEILRQRIVIRSFCEIDTLAESETQALKTAMNTLLKEALKPVETPNVIAMSDEELEKLLHSDVVYKPTKLTTVEIFDDSPEAVAGIRYVLQRWPNIEVCFTEVFSDNLRVVSRVRSDVFENAVYNHDRIMLLDHEMPIAPQMLYEECEGESAGVVASISSLNDADTNITTHAGFQYKGLMGTEIQKVEEFVQFMSGLLRDLEERPKVSPKSATAAINQLMNEYTTPTRKFMFALESLSGDLQKVVNLIAKASTKLHPENKILTGTNLLEADTFDTIEKDDWESQIFSLALSLRRFEINIPTMLRETEFIFSNAEASERWSDERILKFFLGGIIDHGDEVKDIKLSRTVLSKEDSGYFYAKEEIVSTARKVLEGLGCTKKE